MYLFGVKEFHGLHDDLKFLDLNHMKNVQKDILPKKQRFCLRKQNED